MGNHPRGEGGADEFQGIRVILGELGVCMGLLPGLEALVCV